MDRAQKKPDDEGNKNKPKLILPSTTPVVLATPTPLVQLTVPKLVYPNPLEYVRGATQAVFMDDFGIGEPGLIDYLADLQLRSFHADGLLPKDLKIDRALPTLGVLINAAATEVMDPKTLIQYHRSAADIALVWCGNFKDSIPTLLSGSTFSMADVQRLGKRSYNLASAQLESAKLASATNLEEPPVSPKVFKRLSDEFEICARGLSNVRRQIETNS